MSSDAIRMVEGLLFQGRDPENAKASGIFDHYARKDVVHPVIFVGMGTCGIVSGAGKTMEAIRDYLLQRKLQADVVAVGCIGLCSEEPLVDIRLPGRSRLVFRKITSEKVPFLLDDILHRVVSITDVFGQYRMEGSESWKDVPFLDELPVFRLQQRIVMEQCGVIDPESLEEYLAFEGYSAFIKAINRYTPQEVIDLVEKSMLRGRAGGGFPTGKKWKTAFQSPADQKYLICNAQESDPGAFMDRHLIESVPHRLIEGMCIAAYAIGATRAYIYIRKEYKLAIGRIQKALEQAIIAGLLGHNIGNSGFNLEITIWRGPGAFVCGEETALIASLEGRRGMPQNKPPFPSASGLFKKPTVINNVESLCTVPAILKNGADWFSSIGTEKSKGTKIFAVSGKTASCGLVEVPMGTSLRQLVFDIAGGMQENRSFKALQIGGPNGYTIPEKLLDTPVDYEALKEAGAGMGSGGLIILDDSVCLVDMARFYMGFMQNQSCGKCIPCREGTKRIREILENITRKPTDHNGHTTLERFKGVMQLGSIAEVMKDTSLCGLGIHAANPVLSSLQWFREEFEEHIFERNCRAAVCKELRTYRIDVDVCTGCTLCAKRCPENAIIGTELHPYFIVEDKCTGCGVCSEVCKFNAVFIK